MPGSYPGDAGSNPAPATNSRQARRRVGLDVSPWIAFLLGLALGFMAWPVLLIMAMYRRWCMEGEGSPADAAAFEDAFNPNNRG